MSRRKELAAELRELLADADAFVERERALPHYIKGDDKLLELGYLRSAIKGLAERIEREDAYGRELEGRRASSRAERKRRR